MQKKNTYNVRFDGAYSLKIQRVKEDDFPYQGQQLTCTSEVVEFLKSLQCADNEKFITLYLNAQNQLICLQIQNGVVDQAIVYPREVIRHALIVNASAVILAHNHPSGTIKPSEADVNITKIVCDIAKNLGIKIHDHIVVAGDSGQFYSFQDHGMM